MNARVPASTRVRANALADELGMSLSSVVALLVQNAELDARGRLIVTPETTPRALPAPAPAVLFPGQMALPALEHSA